MKEGQLIGGYRLLSDGSAASGGRSISAFAVRDGEEFFIKQFLSPKFPLDEAPGSAASKAKAKVRCSEFEARQKKIIDILKKSVGRGGNLVLPLDFFREGPKYFKVSERIESTSLGVDGVRLLPAKDKLLILTTIAHSVSILHGVGIVHGDLKPPNILIKRTNKGAYVAKVIDIDDAYFEGIQTGDPEEIIGDPAYYSPELWHVITGKSPLERTPISTRSDVFALGAVFCQFWSGYLPDFDRRKWKYLANAVTENGPLSTTGRALPPALEKIVLSMLGVEASERPTIGSVFKSLKELKGEDVTKSKSSISAKTIVEAATTAGRLIMSKKVKESASPHVTVSVEAPVPRTAKSSATGDRLKGTMIDRKRPVSGLESTTLGEPGTARLKGRAVVASEKKRR